MSLQVQSYFQRVLHNVKDMTVGNPFFVVKKKECEMSETRKYQCITFSQMAKASKHLQSAPELQKTR